MRKTAIGFTIVELLIVIVVIAILATISIVTYSGIQTRAENTKTIQSVSAYAKAIALYAADKGAYPIQNFSCLGSPSRCGNMTDGTDPGGMCGGGGAFPISLIAALEPYMTGLPQPSTQTMNCNGKQYSGAWYYSPAGTTAAYRFYLKGNQPCDSVGVPITTRSVVNGTTICGAATTL